MVIRVRSVLLGKFLSNHQNICLCAISVNVTTRYIGSDKVDICHEIISVTAIRQVVLAICPRALLRTAMLNNREYWSTGKLWEIHIRIMTVDPQVSCIITVTQQ
jgi:hypothetical protein